MSGLLSMASTVGDTADIQRIEAQKRVELTEEEIRFRSTMRLTGPALTPAGKLMPGEYFWRDHQPWLETRGYKLRPRYSPDWVASWLGTSKKYSNCEDGQVSRVRWINYYRFTELITSRTDRRPLLWMLRGCPMGRSSL